MGQYSRPMSKNGWERTYSQDLLREPNRAQHLAAACRSGEAVTQTSAKERASEVYDSRGTHDKLSVRPDLVSESKKSVHERQV